MTANESVLRAWLPIIEAEYREMPCLKLTRDQIRRLWGLDQPTCDVLLHELEALHVLRLAQNGRYMLADGTMPDGVHDESTQSEAEVPACAMF